MIIAVFIKPPLIFLLLVDNVQVPINHILTHSIKFVPIVEGDVTYLYINLWVFLTFNPTFKKQSNWTITSRLTFYTVLFSNFRKAVVAQASQLQYVEDRIEWDVYLHQSPTKLRSPSQRRGGRKHQTATSCWSMKVRVTDVCLRTSTNHHSPVAY